MTAVRTDVPPSPLLITGLGALAVVVTGTTVWISATSGVLEHPALVAGIRATIMGAWLFAGLVTWERRPDSPFGPLVVVAVLVWAITSLTALERPALFSLGALVWPLSVTLVVGVILTFPDGRLSHPAARMVVVVTAGLSAVVWGLLALGASSVPTLAGPLRCPGDCPGNPFRVLDFSPTLVDLLEDAATAVALGTGVAVTFVLVAVWRAATPAWRHALRPSALALCAIASSFAAAGALRGALGPDDSLAVAVSWLPSLASAAFAVSLLASQSRARLFAAGALRELVGQLAPGTSHRDLEAAMAQALGDPSLRLAFRVPQTGYVDVAGEPVDVSDPAVAVTEVRDGDAAVATILHDPVLQQPLAGVVEGAGVAVLLALENARLEAEVHNAARQLRESRARILAAGMSERRRLERDLHDTA
ncbi:MAG: hypothetical protein QOG77_3653, partial [Solirubrobacteraceae bacterium]|nr:hypothetical protein [Solirubrobacteraceae bacterium]